MENVSVIDFSHYTLLIYTDFFFAHNQPYNLFKYHDKKCLKVDFFTSEDLFGF